MSCAWASTASRRSTLVAASNRVSSIGAKFLITQVDGTKQTFPARPQQFTLGVGAQIPGFDEAVLDMKVGETRTVIVPPKLGYGANGTEGFDDKIPKDATLIYTLELKSLLPFAPTDAQQKWIADHPNPWET